ncbi:uncharacterized protein LOC132563003 [Ylistrum balloti]|uniref:uncharacterized protein LOC132563000 n=1 Tax=Ylistrum balloti TaxID=509963 RepID=UPI002905CC01|nr:uncharacterized protein LOC132563000 [Ylistrum balloti]XP_060083751.1 uncharacterized protein LOC132563003 [Ylistrum balloti]
MRFHTFVANRLAVIHEATSVQDWNCVSSKQNPADCASRGIHRVDKFIGHDEWFKGPEFLWKCEGEWPTISESSVVEDNLSDDPEVKETVFSALLHTLTDDPITKLTQDVSDWWRLKKKL